MLMVLVHGAWSKAAKVLKVPCFQVNHQHKEYASTIRKVPKGLSKISGTQTIDSELGNR